MRAGASGVLGQAERDWYCVRTRRVPKLLVALGSFNYFCLGNATDFLAKC